METALTIAIAVIAIYLIIRFLGGLLRLAITVAVILVAVYLVYQFLF
jgi:hypothetical protein